MNTRQQDNKQYISFSVFQDGGLLPPISGRRSGATFEPLATASKPSSRGVRSLSPAIADCHLV